MARASRRTVTWDAGAPRQSGFFFAEFRAAGAAVLAVTIGANQAVSEFDGAKMAADIAGNGFVDAIGGWFNWTFWHG
jgi:hypothetical protein